MSVVARWSRPVAQRLPRIPAGCREGQNAVKSDSELPVLNIEDSGHRFVLNGLCSGPRLPKESRVHRHYLRCRRVE